MKIAKGNSGSFGWVPPFGIVNLSKFQISIWGIHLKLDNAIGEVIWGLVINLIL